MADKIYGLLGRKLGHSYSVPIHRVFGNSAYRLYELEPEELGDFVRRPDIGALNVTIPYKLDVMAFCDEIAPEAKAIGAVNTVVNRDGRLYGYNTDKAGFDYMVRRAGIDLAGKKVLILGTGGASKTAHYCAQDMGAREIVLVSHKDNTPEFLANHLDSQIIVNTTPVGMYPKNGESPVDLSLFPQLSGVVDVIYNPLRTALILQAQELGIPCTSGLSMLTAQGKFAHEHFFSRPAQDNLIEEATRVLLRDCLNLVLIGMPGSGKSTVGKLLGEMTGRPIYEIDELIVEEVGMSIPEYFAKFGEAAFREVETQVLARCGKQSGSIIVCGGGVVTQERNYPLLHQNGYIVELTRDLDLLETTGRPLSKGLPELRQMAVIRGPLYAHFRDAQVENAATPQETAQTVWRHYEENSGHERP